MEVIDDRRFRKWFDANRERIARRLVEYVNIDTTTPHESRAFPFLDDYLGEIGVVAEREYLHSSLGSHRDASPHPKSVLTADRANLRADVAQATNAAAPKVVFNCHVDVVPATSDFSEAFNATRSEGWIYGRGACDTKNNLVMVVEALRFLQAENLTPTRHIALDMPIEEEIGGNGTLSTILHRADADEAICLEPTSLQVYRGHRGCLTFEIEVNGRAVHMGSDDHGINAIEEAFPVIQKLKDLEARLLEQACANDAFNAWHRPLQVNIGLIHGGEWSGSVPEQCVIRGDCGFLPPATLDDVMDWIRQACGAIERTDVRDRLRFRFDGLRNAAYLTDADARVVRNLVASVQHQGVDHGPPIGWKASCDARYYAKTAGIPAVIFGCGALSDAHSAHEKVHLDELARGIAIVADFLTRTPTP